MTALRQWPSPRGGKRGPRTKKAMREARLRRAELETEFRVEVIVEDPDPVVVAMLRARRAS